MESVDEFLEVADEFMQQESLNIARAREQISVVKQNVLLIETLRRALEDQIKTDIEELISDKQESQQSLLKQEQQLRQEMESVKRKNMELSAGLAEREQEKAGLKEEREQLSEERERQENETKVNIPIRKEEISLYTCISKIRWDFNTPKHEVKGYVSRKGSVKPFCFDNRKTSQFFITNALWDAMQEN
ncbi:SPC24-like protein [Mya arenaria]|uniref:Kinetochore protein Spc24 n=1 Tax=Mya arenaria TaxID=6604 RepID=A0ABY7DHF5_MYAAR|nr:kinetochore protein spc24-like [Mya arenaria]WAQ97109.1 SPC24-like protein [Mya arenaria]